MTDNQERPPAILLADPVITVERQQFSQLAVVVIRLTWPHSDRGDMLIPLTVPTAKLIANALVDCARGPERADVN